MTREIAQEKRLDLGRALLRARKAWPARGPKAKGWGDFLNAEGIEQSTAWRYMELASHVDAGGCPPASRPRFDRDTGVVAGVYFVQGADGGPIKIGVSADVHARIRGLQCGSPVRLQVIAIAIGGDRTLEAALHARLNKQRSHGEWFNDCAEVRAVITEVCR